MTRNYPARNFRKGEQQESRTMVVPTSASCMCEPGRVKVPSPQALLTTLIIKSLLPRQQSASHPGLRAGVLLGPRPGVPQEQLLVVLVLRGLNVTSKTEIGLNTNITLRSWD